MFWYFTNSFAMSRTVGTELAYDYSKKTVDAKVGYSHKFSDDLTGFVKANSAGRIDGLLKFKVSPKCHAVVTSGLTVKSITD